MVKNRKSNLLSTFTSYNGWRRCLPRPNPAHALYLVMFRALPSFILRALLLVLGENNIFVWSWRLTWIRTRRRQSVEPMIVPHDCDKDYMYIIWDIIYIKNYENTTWFCFVAFFLYDVESSTLQGHNNDYFVTCVIIDHFVVPKSVLIYIIPSTLMIGSSLRLRWGS